MGSGSLSRLWLLGVALAMVPEWGIKTSSAVVVTATTGNTTAPADDFGFANVGKKGNAAAIYLGYRWILTAAHIGVGTVQLNGVSYAAEVSSAVQLHNPSGMGLTDLTDLRLFRLVESPRLPALAISDSTPATGSDVCLVGQGYDRSQDMTAWDVGGTYPNGTDWTWTETALPGDIRGFKILSTRAVRWGTNRIVYEGSPVIRLSTGVDIITIKTVFDEGPSATEFESQAVAGDSGGGLFYKRDDRWELAGILHAVNGYPNQPSQALFGLTTYASDLSRYRDEIIAFIAPTPGDANLDDMVNDLDASILAANWQKPSGAIWEDGDFTADGRVDELDASILAANWLSGTQRSPLLAAIPEPAAACMLTGAAVLLLWQTARRRARTGIPRRS